MQHLQAFADRLTAYFDMPTVIEPNRAEGTKHIRLLPSEIILADLPQAAGQTDVPYMASIKLIVSFRIQGANEGLSLTGQGLALAIRIGEYFKEHIKLSHHAETLADGLAITGEGLIHSAKKNTGNSGFAGLSDDNGRDNKLFVYREDWEMLLQLRVLRDHNPPTLQRVIVNNQASGEALTIQAENQ